ncbi:MAG: hypothetical protein HC936_10215 [Leptolyngbyaceae cyanobacterium SU_3_3]|nr:hypothetical protein [Leptolyngbyaceae cyanobacterium SU_3_3]
MAALLLEKGKSQYQLVFGFRVAGLHDVLYDSEVNAFAHAIEEGMKELPIGERITFCTGVQVMMQRDKKNCLPWQRNAN